MSLTFLALVFLVTSAGTASAAPLIGALVTAVIGTGTAATIATAVITIGVSIGANLLASTLLSPRGQGASAAQGISAEVRFGGRVPYDFAFGEVATKGDFKYWNQHGPNNRYLEQVYVLSTGWCDSLTGLYVNGEAATLTEVDSGTGWTKYAVTLPDDGGTRRMWVTFWEGRHDQDASPVLVANANPPERWTSEHMLRGNAYAHVEADYVADMESLRNLHGGSALMFVLKGLRLYDLRKDSTAGGSGSHRFDDWTTWEWSANPATCQYHFERGYYINGVLVGGMGVAGYNLLAALYMAAANICDEIVDTPDDGSEARYRVSYIANDDMEYIDVVDQFTSAMAGQRIDRQGLFGVLAGAARVPVAALTDGDLIVKSSVQFSAKRRREDLINEVHGQYTDPLNLWDGADLAPVIGDAGVKAVDGNEDRPVAKNLYQVTSPFQGRRLLLIAYRLNRMQATATVTLGEEAMEWELGDWLTWRGRTWEISGHVHDTATDLITLSLTETAASVYSVGEGDVTTVPLPPTPPGLPSRPTNISGLVLQQTTIEGADGQAIPALLVSWDAVADETIRTVEVEYRVKTEDDSGAITRVTVPRPASGAWTGTTISGGLMAGTAYQVHTTITTFPARRVTYNDWLEITTGGTHVIASAGSLYDTATDEAFSAAEAISSVYEQLHRITTEHDLAGAEVDRRVRETEATRARIETSEVLIATETQARAAQYVELSAAISGNATAISGNASAISGLDTRVTSAEGAITAQAAQIVSLESGLTTATGNISGNATAISGLDTRVTTAEGNISAQASAFDSLSTTVGTNTAAVATLATSVNGVEARYGVAVSVGGAVGGLTITGLQRLDGSTSVDFGIMADRFWLVDPGNTDSASKPFLFDGGVLYVNEAVIPNITADKITTGRAVGAAGLLEIDFDAPYIRMKAPTP